MGKTQDAPGSWQTQYRVELYVLLVGLAFGFGIENLVQSYSFPATLRFIAAVIMLVVWLHAQIGSAQSGNAIYLATQSTWFGTVLLHYAEIASLILLVVVPLVQQCEAQFYVAIAAAHGFDALVQILCIRRMNVVESEGEENRKRHRYWLIIDGITIVASIIALLIARTWPGLPGSALILAVIAITTLCDYRRHYPFYFGRPKPQSSSSN